MRLAVVVALSIWAAIYTSSLAYLMWQQKNYRGGVGVALIALTVLILPGLVQLYVEMR